MKVNEYFQTEHNNRTKNICTYRFVMELRLKFEVIDCMMLTYESSLNNEQLSFQVTLKTINIFHVYIYT